VLAMCLLVLVQSPRSFCSVMCANTGCNGNAWNNCNNKCSSNWVVSGNTCTPNAANGYYIFGTTSDLAGGTLVVNPNTINNACSPPATHYGWFYNTNNVSVSSTAGITVPFFSLTVYVGIITIDSSGGGGGSYWQSTTNFFLAFADGNGFSQTNNSKLYGSTRVQNQQYCFNSWRN
jgi:hypothetical protein